MCGFDGDSGYMSDLACERGRIDTSCDGVEFSRVSDGFAVIERIEIKDERGEAALLRPRGHYVTLHTGALECLSLSDIRLCEQAVFGELCRIFNADKIKTDRILTVGLGAASLTPDSVGPKTARLISVGSDEGDTGHRPRRVMSFEAGVFSDTGIYSHEIAAALCDRLKPDAVIAVDALASTSEERLSSCIQLNDTGIFPGSGLGRRMYPISRATVGVPVIAIGVPTVLRTASRGDTDIPLAVCKREIDLVTNIAAQIIAGGINMLSDG